MTLVTFITILWALSARSSSGACNIPGYMVWAALIYAIVGSVLTHLIGRPLIGLDFNQQRFEADFRFSLVRLRENSEGVALYRGEREELGGLRQRFDAVIGNWWKLMLKQKQLTWFTSFYRQLAIIFPLVVVSPRFFSGADAARRHLPDRVGFRPGARRAFLVHHAYTRLRDVEGHRRPADRLRATR